MGDRRVFWKMKTENNKAQKVAYIIVIVLLCALNIYLFATKGVPGAIENSVDLRYNRARDFAVREWAGVEEFPSMLICMLPLALFPSIESAKIGWMIANFIFLGVIALCLRKTFFKDCSIEAFTVWALILSSSLPVIILFMNGQNLLFSFAFFMVAYYLADQEDVSRNMIYRIIVGILLGVSFFKYSTIFFLIPIFIYKRKYVELISSVMMHVVLSFFCMWWLNITLAKLILSPITSSVTTNTGRGFIDLMTLLNGGLWFEEFLSSHHGNLVYYAIFIIAFVIMLFISIKRTDQDEFKVFSLCCVMSTVLLYHRQYDFFVLIIPMYYAVTKLVKALSERDVKKICVYAISLAGVFFVMHGYWIFKALNVSIEYGFGQKIYYMISIIGVYLLGAYLMVSSVKGRAE